MEFLSMHKERKEEWKERREYSKIDGLRGIAKGCKRKSKCKVRVRQNLEHGKGSGCMYENGMDEKAALRFHLPYFPNFWRYLLRK